MTKKVINDSIVFYSKKTIEETNMLYLNAIQSIVNRTLWTGWIKNEKPVNLMIIAKPESGKTELLMKFAKNRGIVCLTDVTAYGITKAIFPLQEIGEPINHILIPDFLNPLSKQKATVSAFIQFMNSLIEEGVLQIQTYAIQVKKEGLHCGLITSITDEAFKRNQKRWTQIGFISRVLPVSFSYTIRDAQTILKNIAKEEYHNEQPNITLSFPKEKVEVKGNSQLFEQLEPYSTRLGEAQGLYGFRYQKQFQTLAKANALAEGRTEVNKSDIDWVTSVAEWINLDFKTLESH